MKRAIVCVILSANLMTFLVAQESKSSNLRQYYSGKFGFYQPSKELNNGLLLGMDGVTEFIHYDLTLTGAIDFYQKQTIGVYKNPQAQDVQQLIVLIPLHASLGYKLLEIPDADTRLYAGGGVGYSLFFYSVQYRQQGGGGIFDPVTATSYSDSKNGGNFLVTGFVRVLIGQIFVESRFYFAVKKEGTIGAGTYSIDPSGFALTLGFQYR